MGAKVEDVLMGEEAVSGGQKGSTSVKQADARSRQNVKHSAIRWVCPLMAVSFARVQRPRKPEGVMPAQRWKAWMKAADSA